MAPHSSTLAWKVPWTEEPGRLQSMGLQRVRHDCSDLAAGGILGKGEQGYTWGGKWAYIWVGGTGGWCMPRLVLLTQGCDIKKGEKPLGKLSSCLK